jgi:DNA repair protein RadA/Sms
MARERSVYRCHECGLAAAKPGTCPDCARLGNFIQLIEERVGPARPTGRPSVASGNRPLPFGEIPLEGGDRTATGMGELDRVLGGGVVKGSLVLIGGDPGSESRRSCSREAARSPSGWGRCSTCPVRSRSDRSS